MGAMGLYREPFIAPMGCSCNAISLHELISDV